MKSQSAVSLVGVAADAKVVGRMMASTIDNMLDIFDVLYEIVTI